MKIPKYLKKESITMYKMKTIQDWYISFNEYKYSYDELYKHFTIPKTLKKYKRFPRKLKKGLNIYINKLNTLFGFIYIPFIPNFTELLKSDNIMTANWYLLEYTNPAYKDFLIQQFLNSCSTPQIHAGLNPKFVNLDGSQMTIEERKLKYGKDWIC